MWWTRESRVFFCFFFSIVDKDTVFHWGKGVAFRVRDGRCLVPPYREGVLSSYCRGLSG